MRHFSIWNPKGGQGKTTLALNLAGAAAVKLKLKVGLISLDCLNGPIATNQANLPFKLIAGEPTREDLKEYDVLIWDYPAGYEGPPVTDTVITPIIPCLIDWGAFLTKKHIIGKHRDIPVVTKLDMRLGEDKKIALELCQHGASQFKDRAVVKQAHNAKTTIFDPQFNKKSRINDVRAEIEAILARALGN